MVGLSLQSLVWSYLVVLATVFLVPRAGWLTSGENRGFGETFCGNGRKLDRIRRSHGPTIVKHGKRAVNGGESAGKVCANYIEN